MMQEISALIAVILSIVGFVPYVRSMLRGRTRPHLFTWLIWSVSTLVVFAAQLAGGGGQGAWSTGVSGCITLGILGLAVAQKGDRSVKRTDWIFLAAAFASIPLWLATSNPLTATLLLTFIDLMAYGPTLRKAWERPQEEHAMLYAIMTVRNVFSIVGMEAHNLTTLVFPVATGLANVVLIGLLLYRRRTVH